MTTPLEGSNNNFTFIQPRSTNLAKIRPVDFVNWFDRNPLKAERTYGRPIAVVPAAAARLALIQLGRRRRICELVICAHSLQVNCVATTETICVVTLFLYLVMPNCQ